MNEFGLQHWMVLVLFVLALVLLVCWIVLPFAIIGTKPLLRELLAEQKRTNQHLANLSMLLMQPPPTKPPER